MSQSENPPPREPAGEPAVERVTAPPKNPKKVAAGRAGAAARKAKQERLLKELQAAKESFHPGEASIPSGKEADQQHSVTHAHADTPLEHNWTPWIIGACLAGGALMYTQLLKKPAAGSPTPSLLTASSCQQPPVRHLDKRVPFHME
ncbi:MAG: hypothetical protein KZQ77_20125 [Candidatus Thiodiazotropha sp. (ex Notomyrtea botanica)]|nr:hypothetical protein [Candidatus Thiodiazotropha sp. (ex Notomyrtea botanica)]